jgi:hypothetical protein
MEQWWNDDKQGKVKKKKEISVSNSSLAHNECHMKIFRIEPEGSR